MLEFLTQLFAGFGPLVLTVMGLIVSLRPPKSEGRAHWVWLAAFILVGLPTAISTFVELRSTNSVLAKIWERLNNPSEVLTAQVQELKAIDAFVGNRDEQELRDAFELPYLFYSNLLIAKKWADPSSITSEQSKTIDDFVRTGTELVDRRYILQGNTPGGGGVITPIEGKLCCIHLSKAHRDAVLKLRQYESSATVPADVQTAIKNLDMTIDADVNLILPVINERYAFSRDLLIHGDDTSSPFFGGIATPYWAQFAPLRPKAAEISTAIRKYLKVN